MNHYEDGINSMWEEVERKKPSKPREFTDDEKWEEFKQEFYETRYCVQTEWGIINFNAEDIKNVIGGEKLTYDEYLDIMRLSGNNTRHYFELCFYDCCFCHFKGQIEKISK